MGHAVTTKKYLYVPAFNPWIPKSESHLIDPLLMTDSLQLFVQSASTLASFRRELKAHLFHETHPHLHPLLWLCKRFLMLTLFCPWTDDVLSILGIY